MKLSVHQWCPAYADPDTNTVRIVNEIRTTQADVLVFPELCTTGYFFVSRDETRRLAEPVDGPHLGEITKAADEHGKVVVCGFAERAGEAIHNSAVIAVPGERPRVYRKTHLFYKETLCFDPGDTGFFAVTLPHLDCTLGTMICYDWRFPESARALALQGADVIACPSNLVTHVWRMAMPVRALENKVYLAVANRTGSDTNGDETLSFNGDSVIYDCNGNVMASADATNDAIVIVDVDPAATRDKSFNPINDIFRDRTPAHYTVITQRPA
ncbi:MAG: carbon-nitrogen hydrolase ['Candidatus Kapabacteria' thiocyanatum]|uniref:CN hydrolase domain-containing protein n=1 Tax=Candidatus Kapaibacterium thiocyanatum TaxID=1895771 RepID=A0A1M3KWI2_9BACT|nr:carbon-nitrogen hydrolase ['Candidatus Kapabacteria' thiocyanatum]OJX56831.1 MAG: hypothetical protein BGO89_09895 ['Candidatus Kapabacteria' thiocyanatum]